MALERTFSIVKPDAVARNLIGAIYSRFEQNGLQVIAARMIRMTQEQAQGFYAEHEGKPFFRRSGELYDFRSGGGAGAGR